ncbi:MAG: LysR family transcriptional regulator [Alphaproteobacteria bacterium]
MSSRGIAANERAGKPISALDWDKLRVFHAVAEAGSFTHAGERLHLSQSAVSRQIGALETSLDAPLFHRHARGLILTEQGELLHRTVRDIYNRLTEAGAMITESKGKPQGGLRITTTVGLGAVWLTPRIGKFIEIYPEIAVTLIVSDSELDLNLREADIAIRMMPPRQPDLIQRKLMTVHFHVYASPSYIKRHGIPKSAADLDAHRIIVYSEDPPPPFQDTNWLLRAGASEEAPRDPVFRVNNVHGIARAVQSDLGIASLPDYMTHNEDSLVRILPELEGPSVEAYFVYPESLRNSARVTAFRDFLLREIATTEF